VNWLNLLVRSKVKTRRTFLKTLWKQFSKKTNVPIVPSYQFKVQEDMWSEAVDHVNLAFYQTCQRTERGVLCWFLIAIVITLTGR